MENIQTILTFLNDKMGCLPFLLNDPLESNFFVLALQVIAHFTDDGFDNTHGVTHFSVADEDEDESPAALPQQDRNGPTRGASVSSQNQPYRGASVSSQGRRNTGNTEHLYESIGAR